MMFTPSTLSVIDPAPKARRIMMLQEPTFLAWRSESSMETPPPSPQACNSLLSRFLESNDALCPVCDYNLRGVMLETCPECNSPIELVVGSSQARLGPWLMACLAFAMALGFDSIIGILMLIPVVFTAGEDGAAVFLSASLILLTLVCIGMLWLLISRKRAWLRMTRPRQWIAAWTIFGSVFFVHLGVGIGFVLMAR